MKRKVIQIADKTLVLSLPTDLVKEWGVKKGEEVDVLESGPKLIVSTAEPRMLKKGIVEASNASERALRWLLSSLHKKGYDEIEITGPHTSVIDQLLKDLFLGFAIIYKTGNTCTIRSLAKELDDQLQVIVRRAFLVTLSLADQSLELIKQKKYQELLSLTELEKQNNQLTNFCQRILNKRGLEEPVKNNFLYVIMWNLEKIADEYKYICEHLAGRKITKETIELYSKTNSLLRRYYELFYKFDVAELSRLADEFKALSKELESKLAKNEDAVTISHLLHITLKTADFSASTYALHD